jgi:HKD family nuclease
MATLSFITPRDQPPGTRRLLEEIRAALASTLFSEFRLIVAYAKSGPLHRLRDSFEAWRAAGKTTQAILGIDQQGTSREALELALVLFDTVYVTREGGITFHPKIYLFKGPSTARAFVGSNNLTVGGTEKNFEAAVQLDLDLPADTATIATLESAWNDLLPASCPATKVLDAELLAQYVADGDVIDERSMRQGDADPNGARVTGRRRPPRSGLRVKPESPLPKNALAPTGTPAATPAPTQIQPAIARGLAIQIKPHHNGEIFLSVTAALQNPQFFNWPFTGKTTPKKPGNPSYPQLDPDPVVNITVYGAAPAPLLILPAYHLNTVYYHRKGEIRITASPLVDPVLDYSVMILERGQTQGIDYEITVHTPHSPDYAGWVAVCNQIMPSGGQQPRKFGWF